MSDILWLNLFSPICLAFVLGVVARLIKSELSLPRDIYSGLSIYLLFALGLKGGVELSHTNVATFLGPAMATLAIGCFTPISAYFVLRKVCRFGIADAAGIAAHYGSVSAVTFIASQQFMIAMQHPPEGFMPTLLTLLEIPGIQIALALGSFLSSKQAFVAGKTEGASGDTPMPRSMTEVLHEVLTARSMVLLVGGLIAGFCMGEKGYVPVKPFFEDLFKGALTLFLLEMGLAAGSRLGDLTKAGPALVGFGTIMPLFYGALGSLMGAWSGLSVGGTAVLATMAASASYIAAPPAVRMTLPQANPTYYLTAALAITFPFNLIVGIPLYLMMAKFACGLWS
jgi:uncharacterized protein